MDNQEVKPIRYGTFLCWLFGHKFTNIRQELIEKGDGWTTGDRIQNFIQQAPFCIRCGIDKPKGGQ